MLLFISARTIRKEHTYWVSIHLMLLFIPCRSDKYSPEYWFQYISCCYLSKQKFISGGKKAVSIHLMLLFILHLHTIHSIAYPVSIHLMLLFIKILKTNPNFVYKFQYISCCYLSEQKAIERIKIARFQYISCCYLSNIIGFCVSKKCRFNTSHVAIYQPQNLWERMSDISFNTSHVAIYRSAHCSSGTPFAVSIHLMLLFIYLFCVEITISLNVSIHLMLLFINKSI